MKDRLKEYYHRWCEEQGCTFHTHTTYAGRHFYCKEHRLQHIVQDAVESTRHSATTTCLCNIADLVKE